MINFLLPIMVFAPIVMGFAPLFIKDLKKLNLSIVALCIVEFVLCGWLFVTNHHYEGVIVAVSV